jgi:hypothetical protein
MITKSTTSKLQAALSGLTADLDVFILSGPSPSACLAFGDHTATLLSAPPGVYYVAVDGFAGASGQYELAITCGGPTFTPTITRTPTATRPPHIYFPIIVKDHSTVF